ncbi:MAG: DUF3604 domain-containing protein [Pseudomonadota bacterium]
MIPIRLLIFLAFLCPSLVIADCKNYQATKQPLFGELHLHTQYSLDAATLDTRNTPFDAYRFAKGEKVGLPPFIDTLNDPNTDGTLPPVAGVAQHPYCLPPHRCEFMATRTIQFPQGRALDFAAVTDHAEFLGEGNICFFEGGKACQADTDCPAGSGQVCALLDGNRCVPRGWASEVCLLSRQQFSRIRGGEAQIVFTAYVTNPFPARNPFCNLEGANGQETCEFQAKNVWQRIQNAAAEANEPCQFTALVGYEYTGMPSTGVCTGMGTSPPDGAACFDTADCSKGQTCAKDPNGGASNLHRNIIFRSDQVPALPISYMEVPTGCGAGADCQGYTGSENPHYTVPAGTYSTTRGVTIGSPAVMLYLLSQACNPPLNNCEFLSIPHNPNLSGGAMFLMPESVEEANIRGAFEPLVEIFQIKGGSECRFSAKAKNPMAWNTSDEICDFENMSAGKLGGAFLQDPNASNVLPNNYVRNALKMGIQYQQAQGVNPFQLGFVGATDNHNGTPGATDAVQYAKTGAHGDSSFAESGAALNERAFLGLETNGGGVTGVWAEENTRDSVFAALKRRETFATSSTRLTVRMFGGFDLPDNLCNGSDFAAQGYQKGVPMGGTLHGHTDSEAPRFAVAAMMDPGWPGHAGTPLQRIQIIKGWVDDRGETHEVVYDVAGEANNASVDLESCRPRSDAGHADLCAVWKDPAFNPAQGAFYYARVLENPSCRWNQYYCNARGVLCDDPYKANEDQPSYTPWEYQQCCSNAVPKTVQQRAWSSPIWYKP